MQEALQRIEAERARTEQVRQQAEARALELETRAREAERRVAETAAASAGYQAEVARQQEIVNTANQRSETAVAQATAAAREQAARALATQAEQARNIEERLQNAVRAGVGAREAVLVAQHGAALQAKDVENAGLRVQLAQRNGEIRRMQDQAAAATAAAAAAAANAQRAAVAAETARASAAENQRLRDLIQLVGAQIAQSEIPGTPPMPEPPMGSFELVLYTSINAAKQRQQRVDQVQIDQRQAILDWHTGVEIEFNPALPDPLVIGTVLRFTLPNRGAHAIAFFRYPEGTDYIDVHDDIPKTYTVRENFQSYGAFNVN